MEGAWFSSVMNKEEIGSSGEEEQAGPVGVGGVVQLRNDYRGDRQQWRGGEGWSHGWRGRGSALPVSPGPGHL